MRLLAAPIARLLNRAVLLMLPVSTTSVYNEKFSKSSLLGFVSSMPLQRSVGPVAGVGCLRAEQRPLNDVGVEVGSLAVTACQLSSARLAEHGALASRSLTSAASGPKLEHMTIRYKRCSLHDNQAD